MAVQTVHWDRNIQKDLAIRIENDKNQILGYVPRYFTKAYLEFINEKRIYAGYVVSVYKENICAECIKELFIIVETDKYKQRGWC